jgi:hypothetical protein
VALDRNSIPGSGRPGNWHTAERAVGNGLIWRASGCWSAPPYHRHLKFTEMTPAIEIESSPKVLSTESESGDSEGGESVSEVSQGEGWWIASDGKWYPPHLMPRPAPPPPSSPGGSAGAYGQAAYPAYAPGPYSPAPTTTERRLLRWCSESIGSMAWDRYWRSSSATWGSSRFANEIKADGVWRSLGWFWVYQWTRSDDRRSVGPVRPVGLDALPGPNT